MRCMRMRTQHRRLRLRQKRYREQAQKRFERIVEQMAESEGITEQLKATDQVAWVGEMNNIWSRAREVVNAELIYN